MAARNCVALALLLMLAGPLKLCSAAQRRGPGTSTLARRRFDAQRTVSIASFGAKGDGRSDDSGAIMRAFASACGSAKGGQRTVLLFPGGKVYMSYAALIFQGPCGNSNLLVQLDGILAYKTKTQADALLEFEDFNGVTLQGAGAIEGNGATWWTSGVGRRARPHNLRFSRSNNVFVYDIQLRNSPRVQLNVWQCNQVTIAGISTKAPDTSPNTDSINLSQSTFVTIDGANLHSGDDCVSIIGSSSFITIQNTICTAGHGYSIGSLGLGGALACVHDITVRNSVLTTTDNGVRIKTYQGGRGAVWNVLYQGITLNSVRRPLVIDQYYCDRGCGSESRNNVGIFNVTYDNIKGTSLRSVPGQATIQCSGSVNCQGLKFSNIAITQQGGPTLPANIKNAWGRASGGASPSLQSLQQGASSGGQWNALKAQAAACGVSPKF